MDLRAQDRRKLELDLRCALSNGELELMYQPLITTATGRVGGFEALLRWNHPGRGTISPATFIPLAEDTGLIVPIGEWVLREACQEASHWTNNTKVAVNLSSLQFRNGNLLTSVVVALEASGLPADRLELEITETALLQDSDLVRTTLQRLRKLGVRIALDDFGTGYSSLQYLRNFPFDKIKIDKSYVQEIGMNRESEAIIHSVISLATRLGMSTTAEGVESVAQYDLLLMEGCTEVQGFLFSRPVEANSVRSFMARADFVQAA